MSALVGSRVEMLESGSSFTGKVIQENTSLGKLVVLLDSGEVQNFFRRDLSSITVLRESQQELEVSSSGDLANQRESNNRDHWLDSNGNDKRTYSEIVSSHVTTTEKKPSAKNCSPQSEEEMKAIFESVRPEMSVLPRRLEQPETLGKAGGRNCHLLNLHRVEMSQLLVATSAPSSGDCPPLPRYQDYEGLDYYLLPGVTSTAKPRVDAQGDVLGRGPVQGGIRERLWADQDKPPAILTPSRLYIVDRLGSLFEKAIARLQAAERFGLSSEGGLLGRASPLAFLLFATKEDVFMFDVEELGEEGWDAGLRRVLEEPNLLKIIHDCRQLSDCLWHQHNVRLTGVYDTMAGDMVYISTNLLFGLLPRYTRSQAHLVRDYLGVQDEEIAFPRYRRAGLAEEQEAWRQRPLADHLLLLAARGVLYLPALYAFIRAANLQPFHQAVALLNSQVRDADDPDAARLSVESHQVPRAVSSVLPDWDQEMGRRKLGQYFLVEGNFVHYNVGNPDPVLIYSKDSMHQVNAGPDTDLPPFKSILDEVENKKI